MRWIKCLLATALLPLTVLKTHAQLYAYPNPILTERVWTCGPGTHWEDGAGCLSDQTQFINAGPGLTKLPDIPMTVADCRPGDHWGPSPSHNGLLRCLPNTPPLAPTCPAGQRQTTPPVWNGEAWSSPGCAPWAPNNLPPQTNTVHLYTVSGAILTGGSIVVPQAYPYAYGYVNTHTNTPYTTFGSLPANQIPQWVVQNSVAVIAYQGCKTGTGPDGSTWQICLDGSSGGSPGGYWYNGQARTFVGNGSNGPGTCFAWVAVGGMAQFCNNGSTLTSYGVH